MSDKDLFEQSSDILDKGLSAGKNLFKTFLNWILFAALIIVTTLLTFTTLGLVNRFTDDVLVGALFMFVISTVALLIFFPQGEQNEKIKNESYRPNLALWGQKSETVRRTGKIELFRLHCKNKTNELRGDIRENYIFNAGIDLAVYEKFYKDKTIAQIRRDKELTREQKHWLIKTKRNIKVLPINHVAVLSGAELSPGRSVGQKKISAKNKILVNKIMSTAGLTLILATIAIMPADGIGWAAVGVYALRVLSVVISAVMGFYGGVSKIRSDNTDNKVKILFINEFLEKEGIKE